jgi:beta-barrel assembly-enhancing protease
MIQPCDVHYLRVFKFALVAIILAGLLAFAVDAHGQLAMGVITGTRTSRGPRTELHDSTCDRVRKAGNIDGRRPNVHGQAREWAIGSELAADIEQRTHFVADSMITRYLNRLEQSIVSSSELDGCFTVKVISDPEPNAYSLPGGYIYVTSGLVLAVESEGQLVAALAHETGHITARHLTKIDHQRRVWGRIILLGGPAGYALRWYVGPLLTTKLLRQAEIQADKTGLHYQVAAGYDPAEFSRLLQVVFRENDKPEPLLDRLYDDHPPMNARAKRLEMAERHFLVPQNSYIVDSSEFLETRIRLSEMKLTVESK